MELVFVIIAALTLVSAIAAMSLRNLVHCALWLVLALGGLACLYIQLSAEFVGFAQILVYIGAVAILIVFAILLTRGAGVGDKSPTVSGSWITSVCVGLLVLGSLVFSIVHSSAITRPLPQSPDLTVKKIGDALMTRYVLPLEVIALLLTAALIGAVIIAMRDEESK